MPDALDRSLEVLACPLCSLDLARDGSSLRCARGHSFDIARFGYASLTTGGGPHHVGDTAAMVAARDAFLGARHYAPIAEAVVSAARAADETGARWCVELAGGTGYYSARLLDADPALAGVTIDVSKHAARAATRAHDRLASVTGDVRAILPIRTGSIDLVLGVFGPRRGDEAGRILRPDGKAVIVTPREPHLAELREPFALLGIGTDKQERLREAMLPLDEVHSTDVDYVADLTRDDVVNAIMMGPNAFHHERAEIEAVADSLPEIVPTTVAVTVTTFRAAGAPESRGR